MSKVLITGDLHVHPHRNDNRRIEDGLVCLNWIYETARETGCKLVLFAGDFIHHRFSLNAYAYAKACRTVADNMDKGTSTIFTLGNHDMYYEDRWDIHSLVPFRKWATVIEEPTTLDIDGVPVDFLPYTPVPSRHLPFFNNSKARILISHLAIAEAKLHAKFDIVGVEDDSKEKELIDPDAFKRWEKVWLGHYHYGQRLKNVEYVGSPMQLTFGEAGQTKHVAIYDLKTLEVGYVINDKSPQFHIIEDEAQIDALPCNDAYIEMRTKEHIQHKFELRKKLSKLGAREIEFAAVKKDTTDANKALAHIVNFVHQKEKMVEKYVDGIDLPNGLDKARAKKIGIEIVLGQTA